MARLPDADSLHRPVDIASSLLLVFHEVVLSTIPLLDGTTMIPRTTTRANVCGTLKPFC
jgi:hypothetical protein